MEFDAMTSSSDAEYDAFVTWLKASCVAEIGRSDAGGAAVEKAIETYIRRGCAAHLSTSELTDFFCVSSGPVIEAAGLSDDDAGVVVKLYDDLHERLLPLYYRST